MNLVSFGSVLKVIMIFKNEHSDFLLYIIVADRNVGFKTVFKTVGIYLLWG